MNSSLVTPGQLLSSESGFMRGHGTYEESGCIFSSVFGATERLGKLISVKASGICYQGLIGDVVIGMVSELGVKRWKININSSQDASLLLSSINLPGGVQRRKSELDELRMREFYKEGDLLCAEVQTIFQDGAIGIHTRSQKYGKLVNGVLIRVSPKLIRRARTQFIYPNPHVEIIIGINGNIWIGGPRHTLSAQSLDTELHYSDSVKTLEGPGLHEIKKYYQHICTLSLNESEINESSITGL